MFQGEILVGKHIAINTHDAGSVTLKEGVENQLSLVNAKTNETRDNYINKISSLYHKVLDYAMKAGALVAQWHSIRLVFTGAELPEVLGGLWHCVREQLEDHATDFLNKCM